MLSHDLRGYVQQLRDIGQLKDIEGADPDLEVGAITELAAEGNGPALLFDNIKGFPPGYRIVSNLFTDRKRLLLALDLPLDLTISEALTKWKAVLTAFQPLPPVEVKLGPVTENTLVGEEVDLNLFPAPRWHERDGGRYIGTGDVVIVRDPDTGCVNLGIYRVMVHDRATAGVFAQRVRHGWAIANKHWRKGQACPVAVLLGPDPVTFLAAGPALWEVTEGVSEYDFAGYLRKQSVEVIKGKVTGLPIPADTEIAVEGEILPPEKEQRLEGPFGEYLGYYGRRALPEPVLKVKAVHFRNNPILYGAPPLKPASGEHFGSPVSLASLWNALDAKGINVRGIRTIAYGALVLAIRQESKEHVDRLMAFFSERVAFPNWVIIVDDDVDIHDPKDVIWAVGTRCEASSGIRIGTQLLHEELHPLMMPDELFGKKEPFEISKVIINACRPFNRIRSFPEVNVFGREQREKTRQRWPWLQELGKYKTGPS